MYGVEKIVIHYNDERQPEIIEKGFAAKFIRNDDDLLYWFVNIDNEKEKLNFIRKTKEAFDQNKRDIKQEEKLNQVFDIINQLKEKLNELQK